MKINTVKNIAIALLVVIAVILSGELWLGDVMEREISSIFLSEEDGKDKTAMKAFLRPYRVAVNSGEKDEFYLRYTQLSEITAEAMDVILKIAENGEFFESGKVEFEKAFSQKCVILEYKTNMPMESFLTALNVTGNFLNQKIKQFRYAVLSPQSDNKLHMIFIDTENDLMVTFSLEKWNREAFYATIDKEIDKQYNIWYTLPSSNPYLKNDLFMAEWQNVFFYKPLAPAVCFEENGEISRSSIEKNISFLFENKRPAWWDKIDGVYRFTEGSAGSNIVVKYNPEHILEYVNYRVNEGKSDDTILSAFSTAVQFIERDETMINEYYLSGYEEIDGKFTFYFDWAVNDFPVVFSMNFKNAIEMQRAFKLQSAIEVTVSKGVVSQYKRLAYCFDVEEDDLEAAAMTGFSAAIIGAYGVFDRVEDADFIVTKADLGYSIDSNMYDTALKLSWFFETQSINDEGLPEIVQVAVPAQ